MDPGKHNGFQNIEAVYVLVDFNLLLHENQRCLPASANFTPDHDGLRILAVFYDGWWIWSLYESAPVILGSVRLFHFSCEMTIHSQRVPTAFNETDDIFIDSRISLCSRRDDLTIAGYVDGTFSSSSRMVAFMAELAETLNDIGHGLTRNIEQSYNFTLAIFLTK